MSELFAVKFSWLIPLLPLLGAMVAGFTGAKLLKGRSHWPIWIGVGLSAILSISLLVGMLGLWHAGQDLTVAKDLYKWIDTGNFVAWAGFWFDPLTAIMLCVVTGIGFLITVFAAGYMKGESGYFRFFAYLGLFIFSMTCLVIGSNFIMLYLGWEGVGLCSYLLIGYYYEKPSAREAAKKAFLVNRIGDFGFGLGIMLIWKAFHTVSYFGDGVGTNTGVFDLAQAAHLTAYQLTALKVIPFFLLLGAVGKSAQFPLYVWLPDAMEGPTPVSALIHAATMVTAGVYMISRCGVLFFGNQAAMVTVACIGAFTALLAAVIALRQNDLKKVFAYSTISQLGYMFVGVGVLAPVAGVFHLVTHAFFKALLFLSSGVVMHAMGGELDMRKMSGLKKVLPITNILMLIGCAALAGVPFLSGFFSKDAIVAAAFARSNILGGVMLFTALLTAYYTFRLYFQVFQGPLVIPEAPTDAHGGHGGHDHEQKHNHEPMLMIAPLILLALGAVFAGYINWPNRHASFGDFLGQCPSLKQGYEVAKASYGEVDAAALGQRVAGAEAEAPFTPVMAISAIVAIAGIFAAYELHLKRRAKAEQLAQAAQPLTAIIEGKFFVDEFYQWLVEQLRWLGSKLDGFDKFIDILVAVVGNVLQLVGFMLKTVFQRGYLQGYASAMLFGVVVILLCFFANWNWLWTLMHAF